MEHEYPISGMTCKSCEAKVKSALLMVEGVRSVSVFKEDDMATISMEKHLPLSVFKEALSIENGKYAIEAEVHDQNIELPKSWRKTYKPILLIFTYILLTTGLIQANTEFDLMTWMRHFMAGFFLVFSFFKLLNLKSFAESYSMYDIIAKKLYGWGYLYVFIEISLGMAYLTNFYPLVTNSTALVVMSISIIGVLRSVLSKQTIQCACLGDVFNLPMSTVTIIEDGLMILMSGTMIWWHF